MNCPNCGNVVAPQRNRCAACGKDLGLYKRTYRASNAYYNRGLEKAIVRDLSGAVLMLQKSLEMNKYNTDARNLLGLIYFEMGETVAALSEWVISKHFQSKENDADRYMNLIQQNPTKLDAMNQAIKKYNLALEAAKQGNDDLAILQLKKVSSLNPNFIRAQQLLALMYMKNNEFERARRCLVRSLKIDVSNTKSLRFLKELKLMTSSEPDAQTPYWSDGDRIEENDPLSKPLKPISSYKEEKPNVWLFVNLILGVLIGVGVVSFLIVPTVRQNAIKSYVNNERDYNAKISSLTAKLTSAEKQAEQLTQKLEEAKKQAETAKEEVKDDSKDKLSKVNAEFQQYQNEGIKDEDKILELAMSLKEIDPEKLIDQSDKDLWTSMTESIYPEAALISYTRGKAAFEEENYEEARDFFLTSYTYGQENDSAIYNLAKSYQRLNQYSEARTYYQIILDDFPDSDLVKYTKIRLKEMEGE